MEQEYEVEDDIETSQVDDQEVLDEEDTEEQPTAPVKEDPRKSRAQERIRELAAEKNRMKQQLEDAQKQLQALQESAASSEKSNAEASVKMIDSQIAAIKMNLRTAQENGDIDKLVELNEKLVDLSVDRRIAEAKAAKPVQAKRVEKDTSNQQMEMPPELQYWLEDNPWVQAPKTEGDRRKLRALRKLSKELLAEGYTESDQDFYDELDVRIKKAVASTGSDGVEYTKDSGSSSQDAKLRKSPVSQSSRTPVSRRVRNNLTPEEKRMATMLGISEDMYAESKRRREESEDGKVTLF